MLIRYYLIRFCLMGIRLLAMNSVAIPEPDLQDFIRLYKQTTGDDIDGETAVEYATALLLLVDTVHTASTSM